MKLVRLTVSTVALLLTFSLSCPAQDQSYWKASSNNAKAITGDIVVAETYININFMRFTIAPIRTLKTAEVAALFDADVNSGVTGSLYRLSIPAERRFLHRNTLCGSDSAQWMATFVSGRNLQVAFFSGDDAPVLTLDALANTTTVCGTFTYSR